MKRTLLAALILLAGCTQSSDTTYTIIEITDQYKGYCKYELLSFGMLGRHNRILDKIGKFHIGDTVHICLTRSEH